MFYITEGGYCFLSKLLYYLFETLCDKIYNIKTILVFMYHGEIYKGAQDFLFFYFVPLLV